MHSSKTIFWRNLFVERPLHFQSSVGAAAFWAARKWMRKIAAPRICQRDHFDENLTLPQEYPPVPHRPPQFNTSGSHKDHTFSAPKIHTLPKIISLKSQNTDMLHIIWYAPLIDFCVRVYLHLSNIFGNSPGS